MFWSEVNLAWTIFKSSLGEFDSGVGADGDAAAASGLFVKENKKKDEVNMMVRNNAKSALLDNSRVVDFTMTLYNTYSKYFLSYLKYT